jgi:putative membrane protein
MRAAPPTSLARANLRAPKGRRLRAGGVSRPCAAVVVIHRTEIIIEQAMRLIANGLAAKRLATVASGLGHIPSTGPVLIVARHYHHLFDGLALFAALPRHFHIVVTLDWAHNKPTRWFFATINRLARWPTLLRDDAVSRHLRHGHKLFSHRDVRQYQRTAMKQSVDLLAQGCVLVIFPEGYPNIDPVYTPKTQADEFLPFKPGFVNILTAAEKRLKQKIPIVPAGLSYTRGRPWTAYLRFGAPIYFDNQCGKRTLLDAVERAVKDMSTAIEE